MGTRAEIIMHEGGDMREAIRFWRHMDGYPSIVVPDLQRFMRCIQNGTFRNNVSQSGGWLIVWGFLEMHGLENSSRGLDWKVGFYEPIGVGKHDADYKYYLDVEKLKLVVERMVDGKKEEVDINGTCSL